MSETPVTTEDSLRDDLDQAVEYLGVDLLPIAESAAQEPLEFVRIEILIGPVCLIYSAAAGELATLLCRLLRLRDTPGALPSPPKAESVAALIVGLDPLEALAGEGWFGPGGERRFWPGKMLPACYGPGIGVPVRGVDNGEAGRQLACLLRLIGLPSVRDGEEGDMDPHPKTDTGGPAWDFFRMHYLDPRMPDLAASYRRAQEVAGRNGWEPLPSLSVVRRKTRKLGRRAGCDTAFPDARAGVGVANSNRRQVNTQGRTA